MQQTFISLSITDKLFLDKNIYPEKTKTFILSLDTAPYSRISFTRCFLCQVLSNTVLQNFMPKLITKANK